MSTRKIPRQAETTFANLCAEHGVTCNPAIEDERGWDYFVQFEYARIDDSGVTPPDMRSEAATCLVQIKSSIGKSSGVRVKLSNAMEFAKSRMACFIVLFCYGRESRADSVWLFHFWKDAIASTLKKARELNAEGRSDLHRVTIHFPIGTMVRVGPSDLLATMEKMISYEGPDYSAAKGAFAKSVGFTDGHWRGDVTFQATLDEIVDMTLGLKDRLPAPSITLKNVRFGIEAKPSILDGVQGKVSLRSHPRKCVVVISSEPDGKEVSLAAELYVPAIPGLPKDRIRYRVVHRNFELLCSEGSRKGDFHCTGDSAERTTIQDLSTFLALLHVFASPHVHFGINVDGKRVFGGTGKVEPLRIPDAVSRVDAFVQLVLAHTRAHEIPDDLKVSLDDLAFCDAVVQECLPFALEPQVTGTVEFDPTSALAPFNGRALFAPCVQLAGFCIYVIVKRHVSLTSVGAGRAAFELGEINYVRIRILSGTLAATEPVVAQELEIFQRENEGEPVIVFPRRPFPHSSDDRFDNSPF